METEDFQALRTQLETLNSKNFARGMYRLAQAFDDLILEHSVVPEGAVDFLVDLFSCPMVGMNPGVEHFLLEMNVDFEKYSELQKDRLLWTLTSKAEQFENELSRHAIGDFIARAYPPGIAFNSLQQLSGGGQRSRHVAFAGTDVLRRRLAKDDPMYGKVMEMWRSLQSS